MSRTHIIAVDWGTTHFRAYPVDATGDIIDQYRDDYGAARLSRNEFENHLLQHTQQWRTPSTPILICGMAGSSIGWHDAGYVECPTSLDHLFASCKKVSEQLPIWIVPGLKCIAPDSNPDVMRGEETQLLGYLANNPIADDKLVILPGTHSKWVKLTSGRIENFATAMTGELYTLLSEYSILKFSTQQIESEQAFKQGLEQANSPALLHQLFSLRALTVLDQLASSEQASYLSGLLLGTEIKQMLNLFDSENNSLSQPLTIIGNELLIQRYQHALNFFDIASELKAGDEVVISGLFTIYKQLSEKQ